jgi:tetratricopeptide (TPR) repeat protein
LLRLAAGEGENAVLAALILADRMVRAQDLDGAAPLLRAVLARAERQAPQLAPLARWRIAAYCGNVFQPAPEALAGDPAAYPAWVREETRFASARVAFARGDMESALREGLALLSESPESVFGPELRPLLEVALLRRVAELERDGHRAESAMLALDYLHGIPALPLPVVRREVGRAAEALLALGLPRLAGECVLWLLRERGAGAITADLALALAEAFFAQGDLERTAKTLSLHETLPRSGDEGRAVLLRGRLAEARGRPEEAVEYYRQVLMLDPGRPRALEAARRGAEILRGLGRGVDAVKLVRLGLPPDRDRRPEAADFWMLLADLAYESGLADAATQAYRNVLRRFPKDERAEVARYRLARLGMAAEASPDRGESPWAEAARLMRAGAKEEEKKP